MPLHYDRLVTGRRSAVAIAVIWLISSLLSFLPINLDWHESLFARYAPSHDSSRLNDSSPFFYESSNESASQRYDSSYFNESLLTGSDRDKKLTSSDSSMDTLNYTLDSLSLSAVWNVTKSEIFLTNLSNETYFDKLSYENVHKSDEIKYPEMGVTTNGSYSQYSTTCELKLNPWYAVISSLVSFYIPCLIMLLLYWRLYRYAMTHVKCINEILVVSRTLRSGSMPAGLESNRIYSRQTSAAESRIQDTQRTPLRNIRIQEMQGTGLIDLSVYDSRTICATDLKIQDASSPSDENDVKLEIKVFPPDDASAVCASAGYCDERLYCRTNDETSVAEISSTADQSLSNFNTSNSHQRLQDLERSSCSGTHLNVSEVLGTPRVGSSLRLDITEDLGELKMVSSCELNHKSGQSFQLRPDGDGKGSSSPGDSTCSLQQVKRPRCETYDNFQTEYPTRKPYLKRRSYSLSDLETLKKLSENTGQSPESLSRNRQIIRRRSSSPSEGFRFRLLQRKKSTSSSGSVTISVAQKSSSLLRQTEYKAAITLGIIMGVFLVCWAPFFTLNIVSAFCASCGNPVLFSVFTWLGYINSAMNPFIYGVFNQQFRQAFRKIAMKSHIYFSRCFRKARQPWTRSFSYNVYRIPGKVLKENGGNCITDKVRDSCTSTELFRCTDVNGEGNTRVLDCQCESGVLLKNVRQFSG